MHAFEGVPCGTPASQPYPPKCCPKLDGDGDGAGDRRGKREQGEPHSDTKARPVGACDGKSSPDRDGKDQPLPQLIEDQTREPVRKQVGEIADDGPSRTASITSVSAMPQRPIKTATGEPRSSIAANLWTSCACPQGQPVTA